MNRRSFLSAVAVAPFLAALAACGDPDGSAVGTDPTIAATVPVTTPVTTPVTAAPDAIAHPTGADDVVLKLSYEGGFVAPGFAFVNTPTALVSGDGRIFTQGAVPAIYPGPLLPAVLVRTADETAVQALLAIVRDAGLLATPPEYPDLHNIADAPNTVLTISAGGGTFVHSAYALGMGGGDVGAETGARKNLLDAVTKLTDALANPATTGSGDQPWVPAAYRLMATPVEPSQLGSQDPAPTVVDWPATAGVALVDAATCARVDAANVGTLFIDAKQNTYFNDGGVTYQVAVAGVLPGDPAC